MANDATLHVWLQRVRRPDNTNTWRFDPEITNAKRELKLTLLASVSLMLAAVTELTGHIAEWRAEPTDSEAKTCPG